MDLHDFEVQLIGRANADEYAAERLIGDPRVDDAIIRFHYPQASEKLLKALLAERGVNFKRSHNLMYLIELIRNSGLPLPADLDEVSVLNPFAVALR